MGAEKPLDASILLIPCAEGLPGAERPRAVKPGARSYPKGESALMWWRRSARLSPIKSMPTMS